jgi:hypothetical protein
MFVTRDGEVIARDVFTRAKNGVKHLGIERKVK